MCMLSYNSGSPFVMHDIVQIVLDSCQNLKLSDFTLARQADECQNPHDFKSIVSSLIELKKATRLALIDNSALAHAPSPFYCAPELFELSTNFTITTDLWSLGCVVYELSLGKLTIVKYCGHTTQIGLVL